MIEQVTAVEDQATQLPDLGLIFSTASVETDIVRKRPGSSVIRGERKVIVIFTDTALIHRISADRRRIKIFQHDISAVATNEIVAACA
jgi:hypothetical protein